MSFVKKMYLTAMGNLRRILKIFSRDLKNRIQGTTWIWMAAACVMAVGFAVLATTYNYLVNSHLKSMVITLNYEGAKKGLTPEGGRFDITQIESDEVLQGVVERMNDENLTADYLRSRIHIDAQMPKTALDKTIATIKAGESYSYSPAEFTVSYSQKNKFGKNRTVEMLEALSQSYSEYFNERYAGKNVVLEYADNVDYSSYDYEEICDVLTDKIVSMISYLSKQNQDNVTYVSEETGYSYSDLINKLVNIRDVSVEKLNAYVMQNSVSKNKEMLLKKYEYLIDDTTRRYDYKNDSSSIINKSLTEYDSGITSVIFIPSIDNQDEYYMGRTKTGLDELATDAYNDGESAIGFKKTIDIYKDTYTRFGGANPSTESQNSYADNLVKEISKQMADISDVAIATDNEHQKIATNRYLSFKLPKSGGFSLVYAIKMLTIGIILSVAVCKGAQLMYLRIKKYIDERTENDGKEV